MNDINETISDEHKNEEVTTTEVTNVPADEPSDITTEEAVKIYGPDDEKVKNARTYLTYAVCVVLKTGASLLGIKMPDKM